MSKPQKIEAPTPKKPRPRRKLKTAPENKAIASAPENKAL